jgi:hypothetical protein
MDPVTSVPGSEDFQGDFRYRGWIIRIRLHPGIAWESLIWESLSGAWASLGGFEKSEGALDYAEGEIDKRVNAEVEAVCILLRSSVEGETDGSAG